MFNFNITGDASGYTVTLTCKPDVSFDFYVDFNGILCPQITSKTILLQGCSFGLFYTGTDPVYFGDTLLTYTKFVTNFTVPYGSYEIKSLAKGCLAVTCDRLTEVTQISLETPNFQVIPPDTLTLNDKINLASDFNQTVGTISSIKQSIEDSINKITEYSNLISQINFTKVVADNPFKNFTELRAQVDALVKEMSNGDYNPPQPPTGCNTGAFGSIVCFFENAATTIIVIAIAAGVLIVVLIVVKQTKCLKKKKNNDQMINLKDNEAKVEEVDVEVEVDEIEEVEDVKEENVTLGDTL